VGERGGLSYKGKQRGGETASVESPGPRSLSDIELKGSQRRDTKKKGKNRLTKRELRGGLGTNGKCGSTELINVDNGS